MFIHERVLVVKSRSCVSLAGIKSLLSLNTAARINKRKKSFLKQSKLHPLKKSRDVSVGSFFELRVLHKKRHEAIEKKWHKVNRGQI